jgi:hypothetical protein
MGIIKGVLKEELENSIKLKKDYEHELKLHPVGSIVKKYIKGHRYYYQAFRVGPNVRFIYKGKKLPEGFLAEFKKSKNLRAKHKKMVGQLTKRIKYLKRALSGKEDV